MTARTELELAADLAEIPRCKEGIEAFAQSHNLNAATRFELTLALEEAVVNIIEHGNLTVETGRIHLALQAVAKDIHVEIRDNGDPFNPLQASPPDLDVPFEDRDIGGLGIFYLQQMMDEIVYRHVAGENVLSMKKLMS